MTPMYRALHDELSHVAEVVRLRQVLRAQYEAVAARLDVEAPRQRRLAARFRAERRDVARLEGISFQRLLAVLGRDLDRKLDKEQAEAAAAELQLMEQDQLVAALRTELDDIDRRIAELGDVDALYREALEAKGRMLVERDDDHGRMVLAIAEQHSETCATRREIREAIECGDELARILGDAARALDAARDASNASLGSFAVRRGMTVAALNEASRFVNAALAVFERFRTELSEVEGMALAETDADVEGDERRSWLDGLIDSLIDSTLENLTGNVAELREEVRLRLVRLTELEAETEERRREQRKRLEELIHAG